MSVMTIEKTVAKSIFSGRSFQIFGTSNRGLDLSIVGLKGLSAWLVQFILDLEQ